MKNKAVLILSIGVGILTIGVILLLVLGNKKSYTVTFDSNGGSVVESQKVKEGETVKEPTKPTKEKYLFVEWTKDGKSFNFNTLIESDIKLVASWKKEVPDEYEITIDTKNGEEAKKVKVLEEEKLEKPEDPTYKGYIFKGWVVEGKEYDFDSKVEGPFTLEAEWEKEKEKFTITFDSNGGSKIDKVTIEEGEKVEKPEDPTKDDYTFVEWQLNGKTYDFETEVTKSITLKAKWTAVEYTKYSRNPYILRCYHEGTTATVDIVNEGTRIVCPVDYETNNDDKVAVLKYELKYGKGLKLVKREKLTGATEKNGQYTFNFSNPTTVGTAGKFTFEVIDASKLNELDIKIENIKFTTSNTKYFKTDNLKLTLTSEWPKIIKDATPYGEDAFHYNCVDANNNEPTDIKVGDKIKCSVSYEINSTQPNSRLVVYKYDIKYGKGLKLVKSENLDNASITDNSYYHANKDPLAKGNGGTFTFEIVDLSNSDELYTTMDNIYFKNANGICYSNDKITKQFDSVWSLMDKKATAYKETVVHMGCRADDSNTIPNEVGQKFICVPSFELYTVDAITNLKFNLSYGKGVKFVNVTKDDTLKEIKSSSISGSTHKLTFSSSKSIFQYSYRMNFEITDASDPNELYVEINGIKFSTIKNEYYTNPSVKVAIK